MAKVYGQGIWPRYMAKVYGQLNKGVEASKLQRFLRTFSIIQG